MPYRHGRRRKTRTHREVFSGLEGIPRSLTARHGRVSALGRMCVCDLRLVMQPWSVMRVRESSSARLLDYMKVCGQMSLSHLQLITQTERGTYLKLIRLPHGITLTFEITHFSTIKDVRKSQKYPRTSTGDFKQPPLLVMNGFKHTHTQLTPTTQPSNTWDTLKIQESNKLITHFLANMFPPLDIQTLKVSSCRRVLLFNYESSRDEIEVRHYSIVKRAGGVSRGVRKITHKKGVSRGMDMNRVSDISDFVMGGGLGVCASDSEMDDSTEIDLSDVHTDPSDPTHKIAISLIELGPRYTLKFIKAEDEVCAGTVLFHRYIQKTPLQIQHLSSIQNTLRDKRRHQKRIYESRLAHKMSEMHREREMEKEHSKDVAEEIAEKNEANERFTHTLKKGDEEDLKDVPLVAQNKKYHPFSFKKKSVQISKNTRPNKANPKGTHKNILKKFHKAKK